MGCFSSLQLAFCALKRGNVEVSRRALFLTANGGTSVTMARLSPDIVVLHARKEGGR